MPVVFDAQNVSGLAEAQFSCCFGPALPMKEYMRSLRIKTAIPGVGHATSSGDHRGGDVGFYRRAAPLPLPVGSPL
jgi:hypothetical protein